jgi:hypothetical protein
VLYKKGPSLLLPLPLPLLLVLLPLLLLLLLLLLGEEVVGVVGVVLLGVVVGVVGQGARKVGLGVGRPFFLGVPLAPHPVHSFCSKCCRWRPGESSWQKLLR